MIKDILLVEDSWTDAECIRANIEDYYTLHHALDVKAAWHILEAQRIDAIILDIILPDENGFSFLRQLQKHAIFSRIPVVMCSHKHELSDKTWAIRLGAKDFIAKPIQTHEIIEKLAHLNILQTYAEKNLS